MFNISLFSSFEEMKKIQNEEFDLNSNLHQSTLELNFKSKIFNFENFTNNKNENCFYSIVSLLVTKFEIFTKVNHKQSIEDCTIRQIFNYLPIERNKILFILALPFSTKDFLIEISKQEGILESIYKIIEVNERSVKGFSTVRLIISFKTQNEADNFFYLYSSKCFSSSFEYMYCGYVNSIFLNSNDSCLINDYPFQYINEYYYQIPTCPLCIENIECSVSNLNTFNFSFQKTSWPSFRESCFICSSSNILNPICHSCQSSKDIWSCLICGFNGCGRYNQGHALEHFLNTNHRFSLFIESRGIWDYQLDGYVHKVFQQQELIPHSEVRNDNIDRGFEKKEGGDNIDSLISEYDRILEDQLEAQRKLYEKELGRIIEYNEEYSIQTSLKIEEMKENIQKSRRQVGVYEALIKELKKKVSQMNENISKLNENRELNKNILHVVEDEIKELTMKKELEGNEECLEYIERKKRIKLKKEKVEDLSKELKNLYKELE